MTDADSLFLPVCTEAESEGLGGSGRVVREGGLLGSHFFQLLSHASRWSERWVGAPSMPIV